MRKSPALRHCTNTRHALCQIMFLLAFAVLLLGGCCSSRGIHPHARLITGRIVDPQDHAVAGVEVRLERRRVAVTDRNGKFVIRAVPANDRLAVSFSARNYIDTTRVYDTRRNSSITDVLVVWPRSAPLPLNATRGGTLTFPAGTVTIPPRALLDGRRRPVEGDVRVSFSAFDVTDPLQYRSAPGDFTARMRDNSIRRLETFGVFEIYVEDARGNRADLADGQFAKVELVVPESLSLPETVGSYSFEAASGLWVEVGRFWRTETRALATTLSTLQTAWNADDVLNTTCIQVTADCSCAGASISSFSVQGQGVSYAHSFTAVKDECVDVKSEAILALTLTPPVPPNTNPTAVKITTPSKLANCNTPAACQKVTFRCPRPLPISATLSCTHPDWYCSDGYANDDVEFGVAWKAQQITFGSGTMTFGLQPCTSNCDGKMYEAAEFQSTCYYGYGMYEAKFQAAAGVGVVTSFFTYTGPKDGPRQDEIDIEIFGRPGTEKGCQPGESALQTNYFVNGVVAGSEAIYCLQYDATQQARRYGFDWQPNGITWYADLDGNDILGPTDVIRTVTSGPLPTQPGKIMVNMWAASTNPKAEDWLGVFNYPASSPYVAIYHDIRYTP